MKSNMKILAGAALVGLIGASDARADIASPPRLTTVQGAQVNITAQWNEARDGNGVYQAPDGLVIFSAQEMIASESRSSSSVAVSADHHEARLNARPRFGRVL
jgi:hypothetical protein